MRGPEKEQDDNLRKGLNYLVDAILGEKYYNMEMDVYSSDDTCARHLLNEFNILEGKIVKFKILSLALGGCFVGMTLLHVLT